MTRLETLVALKAAVEAGNVDDFGGIKPGSPLVRGYAESAFNGSFDAALKLLENVAPEWRIFNFHQKYKSRVWVCGLDRFADPELRVIVLASGPSLALLLAILSALIAMKTDRCPE